MCLFFFSQRVYQFFKTAVEKSPNVDIEPVILENISDRIPDHLKNTVNQQAVLADLLAEVQEEYKTNIKTFTGSLPHAGASIPIYRWRNWDTTNVGGVLFKNRNLISKFYE